MHKFVIIGRYITTVIPVNYEQGIHARSVFRKSVRMIKRGREREVGRFRIGDRTRKQYGSQSQYKRVRRPKTTG